MTDRCKRGHQLTAENVSLQLNSRGYVYRRCCQCHSEYAKQWRKKNAARLTRKAMKSGRLAGQTLRA